MTVEIELFCFAGFTLCVLFVGLVLGLVLGEWAGGRRSDGDWLRRHRGSEGNDANTE